VVAPLYFERLASGLRARDIRWRSPYLPMARLTRTGQTLNQIFDGLLAERCDRTTTLIALGGGVVGDLAGFAAATYQRGIPFIQVPTTLLAQVDSSVGARRASIIRAARTWWGFLATAPCARGHRYPANPSQRELSAGLAEVIKYGLIRDLPFLDWLEDNLDALLARDGRPSPMRSSGRAPTRRRWWRRRAGNSQGGCGRALLNLGHTFGTPLMTGVGYGEWLHGEAVAAGTVMPPNCLVASAG